MIKTPLIKTSLIKTPLIKTPLIKTPNLFRVLDRFKRILFLKDIRFHHKEPRFQSVFRLDGFHYSSPDHLSDILFHGCLPLCLTPCLPLCFTKFLLNAHVFNEITTISNCYTPFNNNIRIVLIRIVLIRIVLIRIVLSVYCNPKVKFWTLHLFVFSCLY